MMNFTLYYNYFFIRDICNIQDFKLFLNLLKFFLHIVGNFARISPLRPTACTEGLIWYQGGAEDGKV